MLNISSMLFAAFALLMSISQFVAFMPFSDKLFEWQNPIMLAFATIGLFLGLGSDKNAGRNFSIIALLICAYRIWTIGGLMPTT